MKTHSLAQKIAAVAVPAALLLSIATPAFAATTVNASSRASARMVKAQANADTEITNRIAALTKLEGRISAMKNVTSDQKATLNANIATEVGTLGSLDAKIKADTDAASIAADKKSITADNRVYALVVPQANIVAAADSAATVGNMITALEAKLQARVSAAATAGTNVTALTASLSDMTAKVADGQSQAQAALTAVTGLVPDNGDQTVQASNTAALKAARADLKTAQSDYKAARADVQTVLAGVKVAKAPAPTTSSTTSVTQ